MILSHHAQMDEESSTIVPIPRVCMTDVMYFLPVFGPNATGMP